MIPYWQRLIGLVSHKYNAPILDNIWSSFKISLGCLFIVIDWFLSISDDTEYINSILSYKGIIYGKIHHLKTIHNNYLKKQYHWASKKNFTVLYTRYSLFHSLSALPNSLYSHLLLALLSVSLTAAYLFLLLPQSLSHLPEFGIRADLRSKIEGKGPARIERSFIRFFHGLWGTSNGSSRKWERSAGPRD